MNDDEYTVIKLISDRLDDINKRVSVVNDSHTKLELEFREQRDSFIEMKTEWKTAKGLFKFLVGTSLLGSVISLLTILKMFGAI